MLRCFADRIPPTSPLPTGHFFSLKESSSFEDLEERLQKLKVQVDSLASSLTLSPG